MYNTYITFANIVQKKRYPERSMSRKYMRLNLLLVKCSSNVNRASNA